LFKYVPKNKKDGPQFEGHIMVERPSLPERYEYIDTCAFKVREDGQIETNMSQLRPMAKLIREIEPKIKEVVIKNKQSGAEYKSYQDLLVDPDCDLLVVELAGLMLNGFKPTKN
jgi:hypothetical protein